MSAQDGGVVFACEVAVPEIRGGVIEEVIAQGFARCSAQPVCIIGKGTRAAVSQSGDARKALVCEAQARRLPSGDEFEK